MGDISEPPVKRMRLAYHHRHKLQYDFQELPPHEPSVLPSVSIDKLLVDSIKTICEDVATKHEIQNPEIESVALEGLRNAAEEFALQLCSNVRRSMFASRRVVPIAPDFESAFRVLNIPRLDDQTHSLHDNVAVNPPLLLTPPPEDPFHDHIELPATFLGPELSKQDDLKKYAFNTISLPPLPSAHTYMNSAVYSVRETDSRKIREMATEEGKLGEQALRKLATAVKLDTTLSTEPEGRIIRAKRGPRRRQAVLTEEAVFEDTMRDLLQDVGGKFEIGPIVTSEKSYRMPDDTRVKRKSAPLKNNTASSIAGVVPAKNKYDVLPPPLKKQASSSMRHA